METPSKAQGNKWLIIFLIYADFTTNESPSDIEDLKIMLNSMLGDIITTPINSNQTRMFVILNRIRFILRDDEDKVDDKAAFFTIERERDGTGNYIKCCQLLDNNDSSKNNQNDILVLQKSKKLAAVLKKTCIQSDEEVFLITYDHGSAFGIFRKEPSLFTLNNTPAEIDRGLPEYPFLKLFFDRIKNANEPSDAHRDELIHSDQTPTPSDGLSFNEVGVETKAAEILKNSVLADAIEAWLGNDKRVAVLLMSNCWMMNLHTMYALKDTVKCLVAPQGSIDVPGYNLKDIFTEINNASGTGLKAPKLAITCVETFDNTYSKAKAVMLDRQEPGILEQFKIFAVDLSKTTHGESTLVMQIDALRKFIDTLLDQLSASYATQIEIKYFLKYLRSVCFDFSYGKVKLIDIVNWAISISSANQQFIGQNSKLTVDIADAIIDLKKAFLDNSAILKKSSGKQIYTPPNPKADFSIITLPPTGYGIFFPVESCHLGLSDQDYANLKDNVSSDRLLKDLASWRKLLKFIDPEIDDVFK